MLALLGVFALLPPFITLFVAAPRPFGIPLIAVYLFGVWGLLIVGAALFARRVGPTGASEPATDPSADAEMQPRSAFGTGLGTAPDTGLGLDPARDRHVERDRPLDADIDPPAAAGRRTPAR